MRTIYIIKIFSVILILSIIFSFVPNVSLAANKNEGINLFTDIMAKLIDIIKIITTKIFEFMGSSGTKEETENSAFADVAATCKDVISSFTYGDGWVGIPFSEDANSKNNPASSNRQSKKIDCSGYVSWVLYKYGSGSGSDSYKTIFSEQRGTKQMQILLPANPTLFKKIGTLGKCDSELRDGDILLKSGHVEIFSYKSGNSYYCYNAGTTNAIQGGTRTYGQCNTDTSSYTVYRVIK